jgi:excisionase family DNA binding protein
MHGEQLLKVDEVADRLRVNPETVRRMLRRGRLRGSMPAGIRGGWRIPASEVDRLLKETEGKAAA